MLAEENNVSKSASRRAEHFLQVCLLGWICLFCKSWDVGWGYEIINYYTDRNFYVESLLTEGSQLLLFPSLVRATCAWPVKT